MKKYMKSTSLSCSNNQWWINESMNHCYSSESSLLLLLYLSCWDYYPSYNGLSDCKGIKLQITNARNYNMQHYNMITTTTCSIARLQHTRLQINK
jgi:hypothetical protein